MPNPSLRKEFNNLSGVNVSLCYQCQKCTSGCPVAFAMDILPHRLMRLVHLGQLDRVLRGDTIWVCAQCETCNTRCPNDIDIARVMESLRQTSRREGKAAHKNDHLFNQAFLTSIKQFGRVHELGMISSYTVKSEGLKGFLKQAGMGLSMLAKGKLKLMPHSLRGHRQVKAIFKRAEKKA